MKKLRYLSLILVAMIAIVVYCCHRPVIKPEQHGLDGKITTEPIVENGVETGYSICYRSWIIPGEDDSGTKSAVSAKGGGQTQDTISVILHDVFYHVDTCAYVTDWNPSRYENYTLYWDRYATVGEPENFVTTIDSVVFLRVQYEEFSFSYRIDFEAAYYSDGTYSQQMPHYTPEITDLGAEELESLESIARNDSVFARKLLRHSIRVQIGNTPYVLNAIDTLYRYMPQANPNKFVLRSEMVSEDIPTEFVLSFVLDVQVFYPYKCKFKQYYSDGSTDFCEIDLSNRFIAWICVSNVFVENDEAHCDNIETLYDVASMQLASASTEEDTINEYSKIQQEQRNLVVNFSGEGVANDYSNTSLYNYLCTYDDGYTFYQKSINPICEYGHKEKDCIQSENRMYLKFFFNYKVEDLQKEYSTCRLRFDHL